MPSLARDTSFKLLPRIASQVAPRAAALNLTIAAYVSVLIWNQAQRPAVLCAEPDSTQLARVNLKCYLRRAVAPLLTQIAKQARMSENAVAEALIARDLRTGGNLIIYSAKK